MKKKNLFVEMVLSSFQSILEKYPPDIPDGSIGHGWTWHQGGWNYTQAKSQKETIITKIEFSWSGRYTIAEASTNNGIGLYANTRRSDLDPLDRILAVRVLAGKLDRALNLYRQNESIKHNGPAFTAVIPARSIITNPGNLRL